MHLTQERINDASAGFRALYLTAYDGATPSWPQVAMETSSTGAAETYEFLTGIPQMREMVGEATLQNIAQAGMTIKNKEFDATVPVKRAVIERDNLGLVSPLFSEMGRNAAFHPDLLVTDLLSSGFTAKDYTGKAFFADDKKVNPEDSGKGAVKFSNKSTDPLSAESFEAARTSLRERKDAKGNNLNLGQDLLLVVPPALETTAREIVEADRIDGGNTNLNKGAARVLVLNGLATATEWFLLEVGRAVKPLIVQYEVKPEFVASDRKDSERMMTKKEALYQVYDRKNAGFGLPQLAFGSTGAG